MHGLISQDGFCIRSVIGIVDLDGDDFLRHLLCQDVVWLVCSYPVPCIQDHVSVLSAGGFHYIPCFFQIRDSAVGHWLYADDPLAGSVAELFLISVLCAQQSSFPSAAVDVVHAEQVAHMEAHLLFVFLLVGAVVLCHCTIYSTSVTFMPCLSRIARMSSS